MAAVCIGAFMGQLDSSIVTQAFPTLQHDLHASLAGVQWVGLSYLLVLVSFLTPIGRAADMIGRKLLYIYGFVVFIVGSGLCGLAPSLGALIAFRILQGFGAAMLQANSVAIITEAMPRGRLARAIGLQGAAQAIGLALGPAVGGLLIALGSWRLIFIVNIPAGLVGAVLGWFLLPRSRHLATRTAFDWTGLATLIPGVSTLLLAVSFGNDWGWSSWSILLLFVLAIAFITTFLWWEHRCPAPLLDLTLFSRPVFSAGMVSGLLSYLVLFGVLLVVPFLLEEAQHLGTGFAGLELMVTPVGLGLVAPLAGRLAGRTGPRALTVGGTALAALALAVLAVTYRDRSALLVLLFVVGVGLGTFTPPNNATIMGSVPRGQTGMAGGVLNMTRGLGTSFGLALTSLVFIIVAGSQEATIPHQVEQGFVACCAFLAAVATLAAVVSAIPGIAPVASPEPRPVTAPPTATPVAIDETSTRSGTPSVE